MHFVDIVAQHCHLNQQHFQIQCPSSLHQTAAFLTKDLVLPTECLIPERVRSIEASIYLLQEELSSFV